MGRRMEGKRRSGGNSSSMHWMIRTREYELADWGWIVEEMGLCIKIENYTSAVAQHSWAKKSQRLELENNEMKK